ncbi:MAG: hypothetical protein RL748_844 [Pseudomonadota bacterium]
MKKWIAPMALITLMAGTIAVTLSGNALAHGLKAKHGGIMREVANLQFELVASKDAASAGVAKIYVEDHGKIYSTAGASGKLTVLNGAEKTEVVLHASGENVLESKDDAKLAAGAKVVALITFADKKTVSVRFAVK